MTSNLTLVLLIFFPLELTGRLFNNTKNYVRYVYLKFSNNTAITLLNQNLQFQFNYPHNCAKLHLRDVVRKENGFNLAFWNCPIPYRVSAKEC